MNLPQPFNDMRKKVEGNELRELAKQIVLTTNECTNDYDAVDDVMVLLSKHFKREKRMAMSFSHKLKLTKLNNLWES